MKEELKKEVNKVKNDVHMCVKSDGNITLTVLDFEGFTGDWEVLYREYDAEGIDTLEQWLYDHCKKSYGDFYSYFEFEGFEVTFGYSSMDI